MSLCLKHAFLPQQAINLGEKEAVLKIPYIFFPWVPTGYQIAHFTQQCALCSDPQKLHVFRARHSWFLVSVLWCSTEEMRLQVDFF